MKRRPLIECTGINSYIRNDPIGVCGERHFAKHVALVATLPHLHRVAAAEDLVRTIDAFLAAPKRIIGYDSAPHWAPAHSVHECVMHYPLETGGQLRGSQLMVVSFPREPLLKFRIGILFPGMICRLDFTDETHVNSLDGTTSGLVPSSVTGPHYHSWPMNKRFFRGATKAPELHDAAPYRESARTFDAVLHWFCADTNIEPLPPAHAIELPSRDLLL